MSNAGVHVTHCCFEHGCKYMDPDCPVATGKLNQEYPCEDCYGDMHEEKRKDIEAHLLGMSAEVINKRNDCTGWMFLAEKPEYSNPSKPWWKFWRRK